jgi:hypothetical protein
MAFILGTFLLYNTVKTYDTAAAKATERYWCGETVTKQLPKDKLVHCHIVWKWV